MGSGALEKRNPPGEPLLLPVAEERPGDEAAHEPQGCEHQNAPPRSWPWFPTQNHGHLEKHPWCRKCGQVAAVGGERALNYGGLVNELALIERRLAQGGRRLTEAQKRLILRHLRELNATDRYALTRTAQARLFYQTIERYTGLTPAVLESYIHAC